MVAPIGLSAATFNIAAEALVRETRIIETGKWASPSDRSPEVTDPHEDQLSRSALT